MTEGFKIAVIAFEAVAVLVLIFGAVLSMGRFIKQMLKGSKQQAYRTFRQGFGRRHNFFR